jgi:hypothetical protein
MTLNDTPMPLDHTLTTIVTLAQLAARSNTVAAVWGSGGQLACDAIHEALATLQRLVEPELGNTDFVVELALDMSPVDVTVAMALAALR